MRLFLSAALACLLATPVFAQTIVTGTSKGGTLLSRPILLGSGPDSLVNQIDVQDLMKKGQKDAAVMFSCTIKKTGELVWSGTYRGTPDSKPLEQELQKRLSPAAVTKFIPAIYNGHPVDAIYYGTAIFAIVDNKPRLRIFSNQEAGELQREADFIGPQPFFGNESQFEGLHYPSTEDAPVQVDGVAEVQLNVDAKGNLQGISLVSEEPPFLGFGNAALSDLGKAKFIPAFRDGKPVACQVTLPVFYKPKN